MLRRAFFVRLGAPCAALLLASTFSHTAQAKIAVGAKPPLVELAGEAGGRTDGKPWSSESIKGKVHVLFYVDPDEKGANEDLETALKAANFPADKYGTIGVINMKATWLPNAVIASSLESKQEKYPDVTYVKDMQKALVTHWGLKDDAYVVAAFDKQGKLLLLKDGTFSKEDTKGLIELVRKHLSDPSN